MKNNQLEPIFIIFIITMTAECVLGLGKQFHHVGEAKSWSDAREYCRTHHTDLASIRNQEEDGQLMSTLPQLSSSIYFGLSRVNHSAAWRWSEGLDEAPITSSEYTNWDNPLEPLPRNCTCLQLRTDSSSYKMFHSLSCVKTKYALCGNIDGTFQLVTTSLTWEEAQQVCKNNDQSLATITDLNSVTETINACPWIGLFRDMDDEWKWIGEKQSDLRIWAPGHPSYRNCGTISEDLKWHSDVCETTRNFVCQEETPRLVKEKKTWEEALEFCRTQSGHPANLASLASDEVHQDAVRKILAATTDEVWTGLRFLAGSWLWMSGEQLQYQDLPVCPATGHGCGALPTDGSRPWEVRDCMEKKNFLCSKMA
ncbi:macrophage mannose receptor 1-like [Genypterus blacodes]|uniref:macrophage mannose receptor 1-like n=1 Tax=Genypterus blacodes TaxID=154954 RepID=UPI003F7728D8